MQVDGKGLREQRIVVRYQSQQEAAAFLKSALTDERGIAVLQGPAASGKSVVATSLVRELQLLVSIAVVDGAQVKTADFLSRILEQFGYDVVLNSVEEMFGMLEVFVVQQTRTHQAPILIVENVNDMFPSALGVLRDLSAITVGDENALRIVLTCRRDISQIIQSPGMKSVADRVIGTHELQAMTSADATRYLYAKMRSGGIDRPDDIISVDVCEKLHALSGGWPGVIEEMTLSIMQQAKHFPISTDEIVDPNVDENDDSPKIIVTATGASPVEVHLSEKRALVGRSTLSDIVIDDQFVSNQHALLIRNENAVVLVDLKSRNGTFVNSRRIQSKVLLHDDIVSIGDHRMKMVYPAGHSSIDLEDPEVADTAKMKNIADARRARQQKTPTLVAVANKKDLS